MGTWLAKTPLGSAAKTFLAFVIAAFVADAVSSESISFDNWQVWVIGALASAIPPVIAWLDPNDDRWGRGANG
jgi:hypothetical protein